MTAVAGVQPQSETVWRQADKYRVPRLAFINKMDRVGANFDYAVQTMIGRLKANPVPIQLPIGSEDRLRGVVDLVEMQGIFWKDETLGAEYEIGEIPDELVEEAIGPAGEAGRAGSPRRTRSSSISTSRATRSGSRSSAPRSGARPSP